MRQQAKCDVSSTIGTTGDGVSGRCPILDRNRSNKLAINLLNDLAINRRFQASDLAIIFLRTEENSEPSAINFIHNNV